jgi:hypothetical protein
MLQWVVPITLPSTARRALTGYVRAVRFQADCDFHVQVASSASQNAAQVIIEIPRAHDKAQGQLMALLGFQGSAEVDRA